MQLHESHLFASKCTVCLKELSKTTLNLNGKMVILLFIRSVSHNKTVSHMLQTEEKHVFFRCLYLTHPDDMMQPDA